MENISKICRTCLSQETIQFSLFEPWYQDDSITFSQMLKCCTKIEVRQNDIISTKICQSCLSMLEQLYTFRQKCRENDNLLHSKLNECFQNESIEIKDENDMNSLINGSTQSERIIYVNQITENQDGNIILEEIHSKVNFNQQQQTHNNNNNNNVIKRIEPDINKIPILSEIMSKEENIIEYGSIIIKKLPFRVDANPANESNLNNSLQINEIIEIDDVTQEQEEVLIRHNDGIRNMPQLHRIPTTNPQRKKKTCLTITTKLQMIEEVENGSDIKEVALKYGIVLFTLKTILKKKEQLRKMAESHIISSKRKYIY